MIRAANTRLGCDMCKKDCPTFGYLPVVKAQPRLWLCERCMIMLVDWSESSMRKP